MNTTITSNKQVNRKPLIIGLIAGIIIGSVMTLVFYNMSLSMKKNISDNSSSRVMKKERVPLYWVAPMDANYRRDKAGKSPMGMDLIPFYDDGAISGDTSLDAGVGTIKISPEVVNNLGVRTAKAAFKPLHSQIKTVGFVKYDEDKLVHIHPRVEGWIEKLYIKAVGDPVKKSQPLYDLYSPELVNAQEELLLALERKNSRLVQAAENRLFALQLPKPSIEKIKKTKKIQQTITFYSPQDGVIENLYIREGFFVKPGTMLLSIGDLSEVWVEAEIFERQAGQVKTNTPVTMTLDYLPGQSWQGKVDYIYPTLDIKTRTVKVRLRFENTKGEFKPNMFAQIILHIQGNAQALLIPKEALIRTGSQDRIVFALGNGRFKSIEVEVGRFDKTHVEILSGLNEGDLVVSSSQFLLDSESSKSSDFIRMLPAQEKTSEAESVNTQMLMNSKMSMPEGMNISKSSAATSGIINSLMVGHRMINISRAAIEKWGRPAATVDFIVKEGVDLSDLAQGLHVDFTFEVENGDFVITQLNLASSEKE